LSSFSSIPQSDSNIPTIQGLRIVIILLQLYCNCHILYCKWNQSKQETIIAPSIRTNDQLEQPQLQMHQRQLNTISNNKILVEVKHLVFFLFFLLINGILRICWRSIDVVDSTTWLEVSPIWLYLTDFTDKLLILFIYPLMFYISHPELRNYWRNHLNILKHFNCQCKSRRNW
jgi:hypothetical protein